MKIIPLSLGRFALVDDSDFDDLSQFSWKALKGKLTYYAVRKVSIDGKRTSILMHRSILNIPKGMEGDHIDGNGLNNQRSNLRAATISQNRANQIRKHPNKTSNFKGVSWSKSQNKWVANIQINKKYKHLGSYFNEMNAAKAYDAAAFENFKEFASLNLGVQWQIQL